MELPETEETEIQPEFPDYETLSPDGDIETMLPDDAVIENGSDAPELSLPEDAGEAFPSDEDSPEENTGEDPGTDTGEDAELPPADDAMEETAEGYDASEEQPASVSGNDIVAVSGNAVIFPEDFDFTMLGSTGADNSAGIEALIGVEEYQTEVIYGSALAITFTLGITAGILLIHGFRLRRT